MFQFWSSGSVSSASSSLKMPGGPPSHVAWESFLLIREASGPSQAEGWHYVLRFVRDLEEQVAPWREISLPVRFSGVFKRKPEIWTFVWSHPFLKCLLSVWSCFVYKQCASQYTHRHTHTHTHTHTCTQTHHKHHKTVIVSVLFVPMSQDLTQCFLHNKSFMSLG